MRRSVEDRRMDELPVIDGRVQCPDRQGWVDIEICLACPAVRSLQGGLKPRLLRCVSASSRRTGVRSAVGSFADPATSAG